MTFWECFIMLASYVGVALAIFGIGYPVVMVIAHKALGGRLTVREILKRI